MERRGSDLPNPLWIVGLVNALIQNDILWIYLVCVVDNKFAERFSALVEVGQDAVESAPLNLFNSVLLAEFRGVVHFSHTDSAQ